MNLIAALVSTAVTELVSSLLSEIVIFYQLCLKMSFSCQFTQTYAHHSCKSSQVVLLWQDSKQTILKCGVTCDLQLYVEILLLMRNTEILLNFRIESFSILKRKQQCWLTLGQTGKSGQKREKPPVDFLFSLLDLRQQLWIEKKQTKNSSEETIQTEYAKIFSIKSIKWMDKIRTDEDLNKLNQNTWEAEEEKE